MKTRKWITIQLALLFFPVAALAQEASGPQGEGHQREEAHPWRRFSSPAEAIRSLEIATQARDKSALGEIFGPSIHDLLTGDEAQDAANFNSFTKAVGENCIPVSDGPKKLILEIGPDRWPFPIPLINAENGWFFDTDAGKEEIICRHIGRDELHAIGFCRAYVEAQKQFGHQHSDPTGARIYASRFKRQLPEGESTPGKPGSPEPARPVIALLEEGSSQAGSENVVDGWIFHGYRFKILTRQGRHALGGKFNYVVRGQMTGGFALVAYPTHWGKSGVMTFIVNQDGKVYQRNLGVKTT